MRGSAGPDELVDLGLASVLRPEATLELTRDVAGAGARAESTEAWRRTAFAVVIGSLGLTVWSALLVAYWPFTVDDTFISLRYAEHVAAGIGPTWNVGAPHAEGYTSPLWIALLALAMAIGVPGTMAAKGLGVLAMGAALALTARLAWSLSEASSPRDRALAAGAALFVLAAFPATAIHAVSGMETGVATALVAGYALAMVGALRAPTDSRLATVAALGLAASLARPELNLFVALATALACARLDPRARRRFALAVLGLHVLPGALYFAWRLAYYGLLLPLPFYVKALMPHATFAGADEALGFLRAHAVERLDVGVAAAIGFVAARRVLLPLVIAALGIWGFFFVPAHEMGFDFRYLHPLLPLLVAAAGLGIAKVCDWLGAGSAPWVLAFVVGAQLAHDAPHLDASLAEKRAYGAGVERAHARLGHVLRAVRDDLDRPVLAALDCGAIAYFSRWTVIDTWGLNEPAVAATGTRDAARVMDARPSVVVVVSSRRDRFTPHFDYEQPLYELAQARGLSLAARLEFLPDYHLFVLATPALRDAVRAAAQ